VKAKKLSVLLLTPVALVTGIVLVAGVALADAPAPTTPYPNVAIVAGVCDIEQNEVDQAQLTYKEAVAARDDVQKAFDKGTGSQEALDAAVEAVLSAEEPLNNAKYAQATCQNNAAGAVPPKPVVGPTDPKVCTNLGLELNRLIDRLAIVQAKEALAKAAFDRATASSKAGILGDSALRTATYLYNLAQKQTQNVQLRITAQRKKIPADCGNLERPPLAPPPHVPTSTDVPTDTTSAIASPTDTTGAGTPPTDTTATDPAPLPSAS
jgi:hypothetical protein